LQQQLQQLLQSLPAPQQRLGLECCSR
jgi:hypothetical protein